MTREEEIARQADKYSDNSSNYARNWICDFILGKEQDNTQLTLF